MQTITLGKSSLKCSRLAFGCWRIGTPGADGPAAVRAAFEAGYTLFDHADIYSNGAGETIFGQVLRESPALRAQAIIATKCGVRKPGEPAGTPARYDLSAEHIIASCEGSLRRLGVETIDLFQLHRPDWLCDPTEVAAAFSKLLQAGKVREFGVSNFRASQVAMLQQACARPLVVNQVEISLANLSAFNDGVIDQCLADKITPMAWSPLAGGQLGEGARYLMPQQKNYRPQPIVELLDAIAQALGATRPNVALAWLLKHPTGIIPIIGSTKPPTIAAAAGALDVNLSREDWYRLLEAARGEKVA